MECVRVAIVDQCSQFSLLFCQDFCDHLFQLFDKDAQGYLVQEEWIDMLKENTR